MTPVELFSDAARILRETTLVDPGLAEALAELLETASGHVPLANPGKEPWGCVKCGVSDGAGACDTWLDGLAVARRIRTLDAAR